MGENTHFDSFGNSLLIKIHTDGIFYSIIDAQEKVVLQQMLNLPMSKLKDISFLERTLGTPEFNIQSENVSIVYEDSNYQLIPNELFHEEDFKMLYETEFGVQENKCFCYDLLPLWRIHLVYGVDEPLFRFFENKYPEAEVEHHISSLLKKKIDKNSNVLYVNVRKEEIDVCLVNNQKLQLLNSFQVKTLEDICYFVLNTYEQMELDIKTFPLCLFSSKKIDEKLIELLNQYIENVKIK